MHRITLNLTPLQLRVLCVVLTITGGNRRVAKQSGYCRGSVAEACKSIRFQLERQKDAA